MADAKPLTSQVISFLLLLKSYMSKVRTTNCVAADGYTRSEAAVAIFIQKEVDSRRNYARIRALRSSSDGFKDVGITHPTRQTQQILLEKAYEDAGVDPAHVTYFEAHGTGTPAGDPEEIHAVHRIFCEGKKREKPLLIGSVKSNLGHTESASGLCGLAKVIGAMQSGTIPGNLFFNRPNPQFQHLFDGSLKVRVIYTVTQKLQRKIRVFVTFAGIVRSKRI